jgi:chromate transporter
VTDFPKPSLLDLALAFMNVGLTSVGGGAAPLRHVLIKQRGWLTEYEFAEVQGIAQALPGAVGVNVAVMVGDRLNRPLGPLAAVAGMVIPSLIVAVTVAQVALQLATANARFAAAEGGITAAVAGMLLANGLRLMGLIWRAVPDLGIAWRCARLTISLLGVVLVAGLHVFVPVALVVLIVASMIVETRLSAAGRTAA